MVDRTEGLLYDIGDGYSALDAAASRDRLDGYAVISGGAVSPGGSLSVDVTACDATVGTDATGDRVTVSTGATNIALDAADSTYPRKDTVWIDATGTVQVTTGVAEEALPASNDRFQTFQPEPPTVDGTVLAEVWVPSGATSLVADDIRDRRQPAEVVGESASVGSLDADREHNSEQPTVDVLSFVDNPDAAGTDADPFHGGIQQAIDSLPDATSIRDSAGTVRLPRGVVEIDSPITVGDRANLIIKGGDTTVRPSSSFTGSWCLDAAPVALAYIPSLSVKNITFDLSGHNGVGGVQFNEVKNHWKMENVAVDQVEDAHAFKLVESHGGTAIGCHFKPKDTTGITPVLIDGCNETTWTDVKVITDGGANTVGGFSAIEIKKQSSSLDPTDNSFMNVSAASFDYGFRLGAGCEKNTFVGCLTEQIAQDGWNVEGASGNIAQSNAWFNPILKSVTGDLFRFDYAENNIVYGARGSVSFTANSQTNRLEQSAFGYGGVTADNGTSNYVSGLTFDGTWLERKHFDGATIYELTKDGNLNITGTVGESTTF